MNFKLLCVVMTLAFFPACISNKQVAKPIIIKEKLLVSEELLVECPQLTFAAVEDEADCWGVIRMIVTQYSKCVEKTDKLQKAIKDFNK